MSNTLSAAQLREIHQALIEIVSAMNRPQRDEALVREAGVPLDRALFKLLVAVERLGPIGVVELADRVGLDYTTISRQMARLDELGFVARRRNASDRRVREAVITDQGKAMTDKIDAARLRMSRAIFDNWTEEDISHFVRLISRFAEAFREKPKEGT